MEATPSTISSSPPSPALPPISISFALEELHHFVLSMAVTGGDLDGRVLGLSQHYCSQLLENEPTPINPNLTVENSQYHRGVPVYPLYRHLARAIEGIVSSGCFARSESSVAGITVYEAVMMKDSEWGRVILNYGSELINMYKSVDFELHVQEPYFSQLKAGLKTVEGRCAVGNYQRISPGSTILFNKCLLLTVQNINHYKSFSNMLQEETLEKVLPGVHTIEAGVKIYRKFYTEEKEMSNGVLAISVSKPELQPYSVLAELLFELGYDGIATLLGIAKTAGTVPDALPPPSSLLLSSSMKPARPDVKGCTLTDAARALAKHVNRCSNGWWGDFSGSDAKKNEMAMRLINRLLSDCCWMNVFFLQPHECVFEIRVSDGYGARWSKDGRKFIGFLEPYSEEGFSVGWKH